MSNQTDKVSHNTYFDGKVQSLGLETEQGKATLGVMKKGTYEFNTSTPEKIIIVSGTASVSTDGSTHTKYTAQETILLEANIKFEIECDTDVAYICYYE
jgi:purine/pyrimidine-nucleoside phosphorylase